jgi:hypothetical protein
VSVGVGVEAVVLSVNAIVADIGLNLALLRRNMIILRSWRVLGTSTLIFTNLSTSSLTESLKSENDGMWRHIGLLANDEFGVCGLLGPAFSSRYPPSAAFPRVLHDSHR